MVTQVLITPVSDILTPEQLASMRQARAEALGFRVDRSPHKPVKTDGVYEGGAKFERDDHALNVDSSLGWAHRPPRTMPMLTGQTRVTAHRWATIPRQSGLDAIPDPQRQKSTRFEV